MKKPTKDDLERIRADLKEMLDYFVEINNKRDLTNAEDCLNYRLMEASDWLRDALDYIDDFTNAENLTSETDD